MDPAMSVAAVIDCTPSFSKKAGQLAECFNIPCIDGSGLSPKQLKCLGTFLTAELRQSISFVFLLDAGGLWLHHVGEPGLSVQADFHGPAVTYRRREGGGRQQMIARAMGLKNEIFPRVLDCTAGLGRDAFVLASLGCRVCMCERVPAVRALLEDGLERARAQNDPELGNILDRMSQIGSDALEYLKSDLDRPDVVYLDPMFPRRSKRALVKKEMRIFQSLVGVDSDADHLLGAALEVALKRVVVKRPRLAPALDGRKPSLVLKGQRNRYDIYFI